MFLRDYLRILAPLLVLFGAYLGIAVPFLEPTASEQKRAIANVPATIHRTEWWEELFAEGDWQRSSPRVVKTENAILLFQSREQKTKTRWHFKPLTIIIPQGDAESTKRAIVIKNSNGAEIEFKSEVEWSKDLPPVETGQLLGAITINSPPSEPGKNDGMSIETKDVRINKRQIWTDQAIDMKLGNSRIEGRMLAIYLDKDLLTSDEPNKERHTPFNGLDYLDLFYVDRVKIELDPGGLWPSDKIPDIRSRPAYATLKCKGSFKFEFHQSQAILQNGVHMEHLVQGLPPDTFDCHELRLNVGWDGSPSTKTSASSLQSSTSNWKVERLEAFGASRADSKDHSGWLKLIAPGMQAEAFGQHLVMDMINGMITLSNKLPGVMAREPSPVYLRRESIQVWSPEVQYLNPDAIANAVASPAAGSNPALPNVAKTPRLGAIQASGAGVAQMESQGESWKLSWGKRLLVRPDADKDLLIIEGSANVSNPAQGRFIAEQLHLWMTPTSPQRAAELASQYPSGNVPQLLPDRMSAEGDVVVNSPQLRAQVQTLQVWFSYPTPTQTAPIAASTLMSTSAGQTATLALGSPSGTLPTGQSSSPLLQPALANSQPSTYLNSNVNANANTAAKRLVSPMNVTANLLRARVITTAAGTLIDDLNLEGNFTLTKDQVSVDSPWPFTATGDRLQLKQNQKETTDITVVGQPGKDAKVAIGTGWIVAPELKLLQSENHFWIDHPGELVIPVEVMERSQSANLSVATGTSLISNPTIQRPSGTLGIYNPGSVPSLGSPNQNQNDKMKWKEPPRIRWGQRMTFDGRTARFGGGVTIDCRLETDPSTLWHISARSDAMVIDMDQPVPLRSEGIEASNSKPQVSTIRLDGNVDLRTVQTDHKLNRRSLEQLKLPQLDFMVPSQTWIGYGPGELWSRRIGANPLQASLPGSNDPRSLPQDVREEDRLQCIHLTFMGRMEGALQTRMATFYDRIDSLIGPIRDWDDEVNVHRSGETLGPNQSRLISDQLSLFDASSLSWNQNAQNGSPGANASAWEVVAQSRVSMSSRTDRGDLTIEADRLGYSAAKDTVRIDRSPRQAAVIRQVLNDGNAPLELHVSTASLKLKTNEIDMQVTKFEGGLPANFQSAGQTPGGAAPPGPMTVQPPRSSDGSNSGSIPSPRDYNPLQPNSNRNRRK